MDTVFLCFSVDCGSVFDRYTRCWIVCTYIYLLIQLLTSLCIQYYPICLFLCVCVSNLRAQHTASTLPHIFPACMYWYAFALCLINLHSTLEPQVWAESSTAAFHKRVYPKLGYPKFTGYHVPP